ncbi:MAG: phosphotransferase family protein [Steroidobacteraceae bacterium]
MTNEQDIGDRLAAHSRASRLGALNLSDWTRKLTELIAAQSDVRGKVSVSNVRPIETGAGSSSGTLLFEARWNDQSQPLVLKFAPEKKLFHSYDMAAQVRIQRALEGSGIPVPHIYWADLDGEHLGVESYVMHRVDGAGAPIAWQTSGVIFEASPAQRATMLREYIHTLAKIHAVDWRALGLEALERRTDSTQPIARELQWYWASLEASNNPDAKARFADIHQWLRANEPPIPQPVLCHGDTNLTNNLFRDGHVVGVIDWEMAFLGTPECDLTYAANLLTPIGQDYVPMEGIPSIEEFYAEYQRVSGRTLANLEYYRLFSTLRTAIIWNVAMRQFPPDLQAGFAFAIDFIERKLDACARAVGARR